MYKIESPQGYYIVDRERGITYFKATLSDFISWLRGKVKFYLDDPYNNFDFSGNDTHVVGRYKTVWGKVWDVIDHDFKWGWKKVYYTSREPRPYLVLDTQGGVIDVRQFDKELRKTIPHDFRRFYKIDVNSAKYGDKYQTYAYRGEPHHTFRFRQGAVPHIHNYKSYYSSYAHYPAQNHKEREMLRPRTRVGFWGGWDGKYRHTDRCWKSSCKKRHQWEKHFK